MGNNTSQSTESSGEKSRGPSGMCHSKATLDGKTVLITGANTGIGIETAKDLARRGAKVILGCRDEVKGQQAANQVDEFAGRPGCAIFKRLDLASLQSVRNFAHEIIKEEPKIHILINNAGIMMCPYMKTEDGYEIQFGVNHLGHFLLTNLLLDTLKASHPSRIVNISSVAHKYGKINWEDIMSEKSYSKMGAYNQSKLANVLFTKELTKRLEGTGVTTYAVHPGVVRTELSRHMKVLKYLLFPMARIISKSPVQGAQTSIYCAVDEALETVSGNYYSDCHETEPSRPAKSEEDAERLWLLSEELVGMTGDTSSEKPNNT